MPDPQDPPAEEQPLLDQGEAAAPADAPAEPAEPAEPEVPTVKEPDVKYDADLPPLTADDALGSEDKLQRGCTDIPCCMLFLFAFMLMGALHQVAFADGDPRRLFYGKDHDGLVCGVDEQVKDFPYVYYPYKQMDKQPDSLLSVPGQGTVISLQMHELVGVCTKECPSDGVQRLRPAGSCPSKDDQYCSWYGQNNSVYNLRDKYCIYQDPAQNRDSGAACTDVKAATTGAITNLNEKTMETMKDLRQVVVQADDQLSEIMDKTIENMRAEQEIAKAEISVAVDQSSESCKEDDMEPPWVEALADIYAVKEVIFCVPLITFVIGFAYFVLLRYCATTMIFGVIFSLIGGSALGAFILYGMHETYLLEDLDSKASQCWWCSLAAGVFSAAVLMITLVSCKTLRMTAAMMKTVSLFLMQTPSVLATVPMMLLFSALWLVYMVTSGLFLFSTLTINPVSSLAGELTRYDMDKPLMYKCLYHLLMTLWVNAIFTGLLIIGLAVAVRAWYYAKPDSSGKKITPFAVGFKSVWVAVRYHFGSAVFGGLLLAIVQMLRFVLKMVEQQVKKQGGENATVKFLIKAVDWFLWCMEKVVQMINQVGYIIVGLKGWSFFTSAKQAVTLMLANPQRFFILHGIAVLLEWLGVALSMLGSTVVCFLILEYGHGTNGASRAAAAYSLAYPLVAIAIVAFLTARVFFSLFTASADAFFFCFIFDEEVAKVTGKSEAEHCPPTLKAFLETDPDKEEAEGEGKKRGCCGC